MTALCLLLTACAGGGGGVGAAEELALEIRTEYIAMAGCTATMDVTADYGERVYQYGMDMSWDKEKGMLLTLTAPAEVAGVAVHIEAGGTALEFDGARIETGALSPDGLSPIDAPAALLRCAREGYIAVCGEETLGEEETLRLTCRDAEHAPGEGVETTLWFSVETHALLRGEVAIDGFTVVQCVFSDFQTILSK